MEYAFGADNLSLAQRVMRVFEQQPNKTEAAQPYLTMARFLIDRGLLKEASEVLKNTPESRTAAETLESAILKKRAGDLRGAHHLFAAAYALTPDDSKIIHEFAQTKLGLAGDVRDPQLRKRLNREAVELLRRAIQLADNNVRRAWCWFDLARALNWLKSPKSEVEGAILQARSLLPDEHRFKEWHERWKQQKN